MVEVRVEDPHLGDPVDGQAVACGGAADRLGGGAVVDAEGLASVIGDVGVDPGDAFGGVDLDHGQAGLSALGVGRDLQAVGEGALDHVAGHARSFGLRAGRSGCLGVSSRPRPVASGGSPYLPDTGAPSAWWIFRSAATRAASCRDRTPSLARIAETWVVNGLLGDAQA